jgi:hypothetical protein
MSGKVPERNGSEFGDVLLTDPDPVDFLNVLPPSLRTRFSSKSALFKKRIMARLPETCPIKKKKLVKEMESTSDKKLLPEF